MADRNHEERVIALAEHMVECKAKGYGIQLSDPTATTWDLTHVSPRVRRELQDAADLADLKVEISKVGDYARARFV